MCRRTAGGIQRAAPEQLYYHKGLTVHVLSDGSPANTSDTTGLVYLDTSMIGVRR